MTLLKTISEKFIIVNFWVWFFVSANAQYLNKRYVEDRPAMQYASVIFDDSLFYSVGLSTRAVAPYKTKAMWSQFKLNGDLEAFSVLSDIDSVDYGTIHNTISNDGDYLIKLFGYVADTINVFPILWTITHSGTVIRKTIFPDSIAHFCRGDYITKGNQNDYYLGCNYQYIDGQVDACIIRTDTNDAVIWKKKFGAGSPWWEYPTSMTLLSNGNILVGSFKYDLNLPIMKSYTWFFEIDHNGIMMRQWFDSLNTMEATAVKQTSDGGFIYASKRIGQQSVNDVYCYTTLTKTDNSFNKLWRFEGTALTGSSVGITDIEELYNGDIIVCGNGNYVNPQHTVLSGWIMKLSSSGSIIWSKGYTAMDTNGVLNYLNDIDVLPNGNLIAVGYANLPSSVTSSQRQQAWLLMLDSNGCEIENCLVGIEPTPKSPKGDLNSRIQVWPNPFIGDISIALTGGYITTATFTISNITGQVVYRQQESNLVTGYTKMLDLSYLPNGVYFVEVSTSEGKAVQRVVKQ